MATIQFEKPFAMSPEEVRAGIEKLGQSLQQQQGIQYRWENDDRVVFQHKAAKGYIQIHAAKVELEIKVGMLYSAMAPMMRSKIKEVADKYIT